MLKRIYERNFFDRKPLNSESVHSYASKDPGKILADIKLFFRFFQFFQISHAQKISVRFRKKINVILPEI